MDLDNTIVNGDGRVMLDGMPDNSIDLLLTDPPYGVSDYRDANIRRSRGDRYSYKLTKNYGPWDRIDDNFITWLDAALFKVAGWAVVFCGFAQVSHYYNILKDHGFKKCGVYVWRKINGVPVNHRDGFINVCELAVYGKRPGAYFMGGYTHNTGLYDRVPAGFADNAGTRIHPTQKPTDLFEDLILYTTRAGGLVCDPFAGSGTTNIAAWSMGRRAISAEADIEIWTQADRRLQKHKTIPTDAAQSAAARRIGKNLAKLPNGDLYQILDRAGLAKTQTRIGHF